MNEFKLLNKDRWPQLKIAKLARFCLILSHLTAIHRTRGDLKTNVSQSIDISYLLGTFWRVLWRRLKKLVQNCNQNFRRHYFFIPLKGFWCGKFAVSLNCFLFLAAPDTFFIRHANLLYYTTVEIYEEKKTFHQNIKERKDILPQY